MRRFVDLIFASGILIVLSPLLIITGILIFFFQGRPVFFQQARLGKDHEEFWILKFCTMTNKKNDKGELLPDKDRITGIGNFLRNTSLDEFPGFWNVLKGEMSLIGPRPLPPHYLSRYSKDQDRRHEIKPGVIGWAQVNGRNAISWEEKFKLDVWYVDNKSFFLDIKILLLAVRQILLRKGIVPDGKDAMEEFMGTNIGD